MALPSHVLLEHQARRKEQQARSQQAADEHIHEKRKHDIYNFKHTEWTSPKCFNRSMSSYNHEKLTEERRRNLELRRARLRALLQETQDQLDKELADRQDIFKRLERKRLHDHWKRKYPELLQNADGRGQVPNQWQEQMLEAMAHEEKRRKEIEDERKQQECVERMKEEEERMKTQEWMKSEKLRKQMEELKQEADRLKKAENALLEQQWEIEDMEVERRKVEENGKKSEMGHFQGGQYHAQQKSRAQQVQDELGVDRRIVGTLLEWEHEDSMVDGAQREKAIADANWMKRVIGDQLEREGKALPAIRYREQAQHAWEKQEDKYEKDRQTRDRLMRELLAGRKQWLLVKLEHNRKVQEEALRRQEELNCQLEKDNQMDYSDNWRVAGEAERRQEAFAERQRQRETDKKDRETEKKMDTERLRDIATEERRDQFVPLPPDKGVPVEKCVTCADHKHVTKKPVKSALERPVWFFGIS